MRFGESERKRTVQFLRRILQMAESLCVECLQGPSDSVESVREALEPLVKRISRTAAALQQLVVKTKELNQTDLCLQAARQTLRLLGHSVDVFAAYRDAKGRFRGMHNWKTGLSFREGFLSVADVIPSDELNEEAARTAENLRQQGFAVHAEILTAFPPKTSYYDRAKIIKGLLRTGREEEAEALFSTMLTAVEGSTVGHASYFSDRYLVAELAPAFGSVAAITQVLESFDHRASRLRGYAYLGRGTCDAKGVDEAFEWAKSLADPDASYLACLGVLQSVARVLEEHRKNNPIRLELARRDDPSMIFGSC